MTTAAESCDLDRLRADVQCRLESAVGAGRLTLEEYSDRVRVVWSLSADRAQLQEIAPRVENPSVPAPQPRATIVGIFGDISRSGRWSLATRTLALLLFGDLRLDLRSATVNSMAGGSILRRVVLLFGSCRIPCSVM